MRWPVLGTLLFASAALAQGTPEVEPNDLPATATALTLGAQGDGMIGAAGDFDFWKITLTANTDLRCWVNPGFGTSLANSDLALIAPDGTTELAFNDDAVSPASWLSSIVVGNLAAGDHYLRVRSSQNLEPNGIGSYTLDVVAAPRGTYVVNGTGSSVIPTPVTEGPEGNDPRILGNTATPSFENSINRGQISAPASGAIYTAPTADYDFFELRVVRSGMLTMQTLPTAPFPAMRDTVLFLADASLAPLASDDDSGSGHFSLLTQFVNPGTYHVVVTGLDTGNYDLDIRLTPMAQPGAASVTVRPGGCGPTLGVRQTVGGPLVRTEVPVLGSAFYVDGGNRPANALLIHVIGTDTLFTPLGPLGAPGCQLEVDPIDQSFAVASASGTDFWVLNSPLDIAFIGLTVEQQIAVIDVNANALGMTVSNRVSSVCGIHN